MIRASLFLIAQRPMVRTGPLPADLTPDHRYIVLGRMGALRLGDFIMASAAPVPIPGNATVIRDGRDPWRWRWLQQNVPAVANRILLVRWRTGLTVQYPTGPRPEIKTGSVDDFADTGLPQSRLVGGKFVPVRFFGDAEDAADGELD